MGDLEGMVEVVVMEDQDSVETNKTVLGGFNSRGSSDGNQGGSSQSRSGGNNFGGRGGSSGFGGNGGGGGNGGSRFGGNQQNSFGRGSSESGQEGQQTIDWEKIRVANGWDSFPNLFPK